MNHPLVADHAELDKLLRQLLAALETVDVELIYQSLDFFWARLAMHIRAEHLHLFPAILGAVENHTQKNARIPSLSEARNTLKNLQNDHNFFMRELLAAIKQIRELRENTLFTDLTHRISAVREMISSVSRRLEIHNELEETEVYLWTDALFNSSEQKALNEQMRKEIENLPPRFNVKNES